jgi:hypothetical protein
MTYRAMPMPRRLFPTILVVFGVVAVALVVATVLGNGPPVAFLAFWLFAYAWNAYWWSLRLCTEVSVDTGVLRWRTGVLAREAPMSAVRAVRPSRWSPQFAVIELDGRRPLLVPVRYGFGRLARSIASAAPQARVEEA